MISALYVTGWCEINFLCYADRSVPSPNHLSQDQAGGAGAGLRPGPGFRDSARVQFRRRDRGEAHRGWRHSTRQGHESAASRATQHAGAAGQPMVQVVACIAGRGFKVRREDMQKLLRSTLGKVFTLQNTQQLVAHTHRARERNSGSPASASTRPGQ